MQNRSKEQIIQDIKETHKRLASLHEELFSKLSLGETQQQDNRSKNTHIDNKPDIHILKEGDQVLILTKGIGANKGDQATVTKVDKVWISIRVNKNDRNTQRKSHNLRLVK